MIEALAAILYVLWASVCRGIESAVTFFGHLFHLLPRDREWRRLE